MNWVHLLVQIVEEIEQHSYKDGTTVTKYLTKFPKNSKNLKKNKTSLLVVSIWQNSNQLLERIGNNSKLLYKSDDLVLIEGFLSIQSDFENPSVLQQNKKFEILVLNHSDYI